ncbi:cytochrome P450 [Exilibacterium tricleocarpae]|uniref:Cytochrome P450 n=1 Tax=Exilibacterium tricleocarpae TaxID=2591008 RepID=A0A545SSQ0_9GAMM|nr:cytochrome P450 [Exilibacterium tricleocarpae]TQV68000.1 cytochrome P450 [Exilibacterium tricleocarpae]
MSSPPRPGIAFNSAAHLADPFATYATLRARYPVCRVEPDGLCAITRYDDVQFAMRRHDIFSSSGFKPLLQPDWLSEECNRGGFMLAEDPPDHTKHRAIVNKAFVTRVVAELIPLMQQRAGELVEAIQEKTDAGRPVDFVQDFSYPYIGKIIGRITGTEETQTLEEISDWIAHLETIPPTRPDDAYIEELEAVLIKQNDYFRSIIRDRRATPRADLVTALVQAEVDGQKLTDDLLRQSLDLFLGAGFQTTIQTLNHAIMQLARQPGLMHDLRSAPALIPAFLEEVLRFNPPGHCVLRKTMESVTLSGVTLPAGQYVLVVVASANRDPEHFPDPDTFDIARENAKQHMAFGYGIHACIGSNLARLELKIALETILQRFSEVSCPADAELPWIDSFLSRGVTQLPLRFQ